MPRSIAVYVTDLIFATKIRSTAESLGTDVRLVRSAEALAGQLTGTDCDAVIIDLDADGDPLEAIRATRRAKQPPRIIAYAPHVRTDLLTEAERAGADVVMPRSAFSAELPELLGSARRAGSDSRGTSVRPHVQNGENTN